MKQNHLLLFSGLVYAAKASSISQEASCPDDCSGHGHCVEGKQSVCSCDAGYFLRDCSLDLGNNTYVVAAQVFFGLLFCSIMCLCCYVFFKKPTTNIQTPITNLRKMTFASVAFLCLAQLAFLVDPMHVNGLFPRVAIQILYCIPYLMSFNIFICTLFHWIELFNTSVHTMNKEAMLQKINKTYQPKEVTVEEVIEQVKFLRKLVIPFAVVVGILLTILLAISILIGLEIREYGMQLGFQTVVALCWLSLFVGLLFYGRKLVDLMPPQLYKKVNKLWWRISALSFFYFVCTTGIFIGFATSGRTDSIAFIALCLTYEFFWVISSMFTLCVFVHWESYFPYFSKQHQPQTHNAALSPQASDISITLPAELLSSPQLARTLSSLKIKRTGIDFSKAPHNSSSSFYGESPEGSPTGTSPMSTGSGRSRSNTPLNKSYLKAIRDPSDNDINQISMASIGIAKNAENGEDTEPATDDETASVDSQQTEAQTPPKVEPFDWLSVGTGRKIAYPYDSNFSRSFSLRDGTSESQDVSPTSARRNSEG